MIKARTKNKLSIYVLFELILLEIFIPKKYINLKPAPKYSSFAIASFGAKSKLLDFVSIFFMNYKKFVLPYILLLLYLRPCSNIESDFQNL